jgi:hypothetical protein
MDREQEEILDLLSLAPSSFAALYGFLVRGGTAPDVRRVWTILTELELGGKLRLWKLSPDGGVSEMSKADREAALAAYENWLAPMGNDVAVDSVSVDSIGCWLTPIATPTDSAASPAWELDEDGTTGEVTIHAADEVQARRILADWIARKRYSVEPQEPKLESVIGYRLRSGQFVDGGVRLITRIQKGPQKPQ